MKRALALLLSIAMMLSVLPASAVAEDAVLPPGSAPTNIRWDRYYWNGSETDQKGWLTFDAADGENHLVEFYKKASAGESEDTFLFSTKTFCYPFESATSANLFQRDLVEPVQTGDYYAMITPLGDGLETGEGASIQSPLWHYTRPEVQLTVSRPSWDETNKAAVWSNDFQGEDAVERYWVRYYCNPSENRFAGAEFIAGQNYYPGDTTPHTIPDSILATGGSGWYFFTVQTWSSDVTAATSGNASNPSSGFYLEGIQPDLSVTDPKWGEGMTMTWNDTSLKPDSVDRYWVQFAYNAEENDFAGSNSLCYFYYYAKKAPHAICDNALNKGGDGWYFFRVQAISGDATVADSRWSEWSDGCYYQAAIADNPATDLCWDVRRTANGAEVSPGYISFTGTAGTKYHLCVYRNGEVLPLIDKVVTCYTGWYNLLPFHYEPSRAITGDYYFTVQELPDGTAPSDCPVQTSELWSYQRPETILSVSDCTWNIAEGTILWTAEQSMVSEYEIAILYNDTEDDPALAQVIYEDWCGSDDLPYALPADILNENNTGWYYFSVLPITNDPTAALTADTPFVSPALRFTPRLPSPENLQWGVYYINGQPCYEPGYVCFSPVEGAVRYDITVWQVDGELETAVHTPSLLPSDDPEDWAWLFVAYEIPAGYEYYYTVCAVGDDINNRNSLPATSERWYYSVPDVQLEVSDPTWNQETNTLSWNTNLPELVDRYQYRVYYSDNADEIGQEICFGVHRPENEGPFMDELLDENGEGWYRFCVRALSSDLTQAADSAWSDFSTVILHQKLVTLSSPTGVHWSDNGAPRWDFVSDGQLFELQFLSADQQTDDPGSLFWPEDDVYYLSLESYTAESAYEALDYFVTECITDSTVGLYFRVRATSYSEDGNTLIASSDWIYSSYYCLADHTLPTKPDACDLKWHADRDMDGDDTPYTGAVSFTGTVDPSLDDFTKYRVDFYRESPSGDQLVCNYSAACFDDQKFVTFYPIEDHPSVFTTGTYYFTVTALGDNVTSIDGKPVCSDSWYYEQPKTTLTAANPAWTDDMYLDWDFDTENEDLLKHYSVEFCFNPKEDNLANAYRFFTGYYEVGEPLIPMDYVLKYNTGWYYFRVKAVPEDVEEACASEWTAMSKGFYYKKPTLILGPTDLSWDMENLTLSWNDPYSDLVHEYRVRYYFGKTSSATPQVIKTYWYDADNAPPKVPMELLQEYGEGCYYYAVRTYTAKPLQALSNTVWSDMSERLRYSGPSQKMSNPTDLAWDVTRSFNDGNTHDNPGYISFRGEVVGERTYFNVSLYRKETSEDVLVDTFRCSIRNNRIYPYCNLNLFDECPEKMTTGTYYFTVSAEGDGITYGNSDAVVSDTWDYVRPSTELMLSNPSWNDDMSLCWTDTSTNNSHASYYEVHFNYVPEDGVMNENDWISNEFYFDGDDRIIPRDLLSSSGSGNYYFRVRAVSSNIHNAISSGWTEWSPPFRYALPTEALSVSNPIWNDDMTVNWTNDFDDPQLAGSYTLCFYYSKDGTVPTNLNNCDDRHEITPGIYWKPGDGWSNTQRLLKDFGAGTYFFRIKANSADPLTMNSSDWSALSAGKYYAGPTEIAPAPTDLQWNVERWGTNGKEETPGVISFVCNHLSEYTEYEIKFFRKEADGDVCVGTTYNREWANTRYCSVWPFEQFPDAFTTGTYYFTVTALGDGVITRNSEAVVSDTWNYVRPNVELQVSDPVWGNNMHPSWTDAIENFGNVRYYDLQFQYVPKGGSFHPDDWNWSSSYWPSNEWGPLVPHELLEDYGSGDYYFRVCAISEDIEAAVNSTYSNWSAAFSYTEPSAQLDLTDPKWEDTTLTATSSFDKDLAAYYEVCFYISQDGTKPTDLDAWDHGFDCGQLPTDLPQWIVEDYGYVTYFFRVRAISADPTKVRTGDWSELSPGMTLTAPESKLGNASELQWNVTYEWEWSENDERHQVPVIRYGSIGFKRADVDQSHYDINIYREGEDEPVSENSWGFGSNRNREYLDVTSFIYDDLPSGTYYFKIRAKGDGVNYNHGDWVDSRDYENGVWTYTEPDAQLAKPTGMRWDDRNYTDWEGNELIAALWTPVDGAGYYEVDFYYAATETGAKESLGGTFDINADDSDLFTELWEDEIARYGDGWYFFKVRAISGNITQTRNSEWSDFSRPYPLGQLSDYTKNETEKIADSVSIESTPADIQKAVEDVAALPQMNAVLAADITNSNTVAQLKQLEETVASVLNVDIREPEIANTQLKNVMDTDEIQISNMALNVDTSSTEERSIQLKIEELNNDSTLPELNPTLYSATIPFAMHIDGAQDADGNQDNGCQLAVPVKMIMPVPKNINPQFLVILHHKLSDDSWEEIHPHVYQDAAKDNKWFATFVVDSFSNFTLAESTVSANRAETKITITTNGLNAADTLYWGAVYSKDGQMLGICPVTVTEGNGLGIIETPLAAQASYVRLFSVASDGSWIPQEQALPVNVK